MTRQTSTTMSASDPWWTCQWKIAPSVLWHWHRHHKLVPSHPHSTHHWPPLTSCQFPSDPKWLPAVVWQLGVDHQLTAGSSWCWLISCWWWNMHCQLGLPIGNIACITKGNQPWLYIHITRTQICKKKCIYLFINRPGVAGAVQQTTLWFIHWLIHRSFSSKSSIHRKSKTIRSRDLTFCRMFSVHHLSCVMCRGSCVMYHLSPITCHLSPVTCHLSPVTCNMSCSYMHLISFFQFHIVDMKTKE